MKITCRCGFRFRAACGFLFASSLIHNVGMSCNASEAVFAENFEGVRSLAGRGWTVKATPSQSQWTLENGHLKAVFMHSPYKGGAITRRVPTLTSGTFSFRVRLGLGEVRNYDHLSLAVNLYGQMTAFKRFQGRHVWMAYFPSLKKWVLLAGSVPLRRWVNIKIVFDRPRRRIEYYCQDMEYPAYIMEPTPDPAPHTQPQTETLTLTNYGVCRGTVTHWIDDIKLTRQIPVRPEATGQTILFRGISAGRLHFQPWFRQRDEEKTVKVFLLKTVGRSIKPRNLLRLDRMPARRHILRAKRIILADMPVSATAEIMPGHLLRAISDQVNAGAHLIIFGGAFALGKGGYANTPLAPLLPVRLAGPWKMQRFPVALPLVGESPPPAAAPETIRPAVLWYHPLPARPEATVILRAGGQPLLVRWRRGKGWVSVFLGAAYGKESELAGKSQQAFWRKKVWGQLMDTIMNPQGKSNGKISRE